MEIIQVPTPAFIINDDGTVSAPEPEMKVGDPRLLYVFSRRYLNLADFQKYMEEKRVEGATKCFFYSMFTQTDPNYPEPYHMLLWVRCLFYKPKEI